MTNFDKYTNYQNGYGVSGVVFGANSPVLEVELNEMQEIQRDMLKNAINSIIGDSKSVFMTNLDNMTLKGTGIVTIEEGATFIYNGFILTLPKAYQIDTKPLSTDVPTILYLNILEDIEADNDLSKGGYTSATETKPSWGKDTRFPMITSNRKVIRFNIGTKSDFAIESTSEGFQGYTVSVPIAQLKNRWLNKVVKEVNLNKLADKLYNIDSYDMSDVYGVEVDYENGVVTRLADSIGKTGGEDFDNIQAFNRRRCLITENGEIVAYYGESGYYDDKLGETTSPVRTVNGKQLPAGTRINTMVEQNKFYYKVVPVQIDKIEGEDSFGYHTRKVRYYISDTFRPGFKLHPAFLKESQDGTVREFDKIYIGAYKSVAYENGRGFLNDAVYESEFEDINYETSKMSSVSGVVPVSGLYYDLNMQNIRQLLANMNADGYWRMKDITVMSMDILLFLIEYATLDAQRVLGRGWVDYFSGGASTNQAKPNGLTHSLGNASSTPAFSDTYGAISYRGEENIFGGLFEYIEGYRADFTSGWSNVLQTSDSYQEYNNIRFYQEIGMTGFISAFGYDYEDDWLFIPTEALGTSISPVCDGVTRYGEFSDDGYVLAYGGNWYSHDNAGICNIVLTMGDHSVDFGSRMVYFPHEFNTIVNGGV